MTTYEILKMNESLLQTMSKNGVNVNDVNNLAVYEEYIAMKKQGTKVRYIATYLADKFGITDRAVFKIVKRLSQTPLL